MQSSRENFLLNGKVSAAERTLKQINCIEDSKSSHTRCVYSKAPQVFTEFVSEGADTNVCVSRVQLLARCCLSTSDRKLRDT